MRSFRTTTAACFLTLAMGGTVQADDCSALLKNGIFDTRSSLNIQDRARSYSNWFCSVNFTESSQADSFGAEVGFPFMGVPVKFGFNSSSESFGKWYSRFCQDTRESFSEHTRVEEHARTASNDVLNAFNKCVTSDGFHVWLEYGPDVKKVKVFTLAATFRSPNPARIPYAAIKEFVAPGVSCSPRPKGVKVARPTQRFICTRTSNDEVRIALNSDEYEPDGGGSLTLPAIIPGGPPPVVTESPLEVTAVPVFVDFTPRRSGGPRPGCACGSRDIAFPNGPYPVKVGEEFTFRYDAAPICVGQDFDNFNGTISWGEASTKMANNKNNAQFPGIFGTMKVKFSKRGDYNVVANFSLDCKDVSCSNTCSASGTTEVHVR